MALNQDKFSLTYTQQFLRLLNFLRQKCQDTSEAEDIAQESFSKLWQNRDKIEDGKETSFLFTIANNLFIDLRRRDQVKLKYVQNFRSTTNTDCPEYEYRSKEFSNFIDSKINSMPEKSRDVFIMNKIDKMTYSEIAVRIGLSVKSVEKRMAVALKTYRELRRF